MERRRVLNLNELELERVRAHGGEGEVDFRRVFDADAFEGPWSFVDYAVLAPGVSIGRHTHGANEELYLILEGRGTMHRDGEDFPVRAGDVVLNRKHGTHGLVNDSDAPLRLFVVEVRADAPGRADG